MNESSVIDRILRQARVIAVVGLSSRPQRPSHVVSEYMQHNGFRVVPINPNETSVLGEKAYGSLRQIEEAVDLVNVFRKSDEVRPVVEDAIAIGAPAIWLQEGVVDFEAAQRAEKAGLDVVMDRCILKEHMSRS